MKFISILLILLPLGLFSQNLKEKDKIAVLKVLNDQADAWNRGDIKGYMEGYWKSDSLKFITKGGMKQGWENVLSMYQKSYPGKAEMGHLDFEFKNISLIGKNVVQVYGTWKLTETGKEASGTFSLLLKKQKGKWLIVIDHTF